MAIIPDLEEKVTNHGVSAESKRMCEANEYFQSPEEEKMKPKLQPTTLGTLDLSHYETEPVRIFLSDLEEKVTNHGVSAESHRWILDSGASYHLSGSQPLFEALYPYDHEVTLADGRSAPTTGIGDVRLSDNLTLKDVLYAEGFPYNLISVSALTQQHHCSVEFTSDHYVILDLTRCQMIGMGRQSGNLYMLDSSNLFSFPP